MPKNSSKWIYLGMAKDHDELRLNSITLLIGKMYSLQEKLLGYGYVFSFFSSVQLFSHVWFFATHEQQHARPPCSSPTPGVYPNSCHWVGDAIKPSHPLSSLSPPALNLSSIKVFSNEYALHIRWPKYWSFSFSISPSNEHPGLVSFRMDWLELLAVQGTLKSLLQHHSSKASILWCSAFFTVQLSHPYMTTGKTIALTRRTFVGKVMSLLFNMLFSLVITFHPRSKCLNFMDALIICNDFGAQK